MVHTNEHVPEQSRPDAQLRLEVLDLRAALRTRPHIARALGVLQGRYGLASDDAFTLLRDSAQRFNLKLYALASSFLIAAPPRQIDGGAWFPGRGRSAAPVLSFAPQPADRHVNRTAMLGLFLDTVLLATGATMGDAQLVDVSDGSLRLEQHRGLPREFVTFFATIDDTSTACATALQRRERVVVTDVAADPVFAGAASRDIILDAGIRAQQSTPLLATPSRCIGMVSTHYPVAGHVPQERECAEIDRLAAEMAAWLDWHQRTVVQDALEYIHQRAIQQIR